MVGAMAAIAAAGCRTMAAPRATSNAQAAAMFAYVGCYTTKQRNGRGEGISVYRIGRASDTWTHVQLSPDIVNPSFLTLDRQQRFLYSRDLRRRQDDQCARTRRVGADAG
jgi:hypothetical protein